MRLLLPIAAIAVLAACAPRVQTPAPGPAPAPAPRSTGVLIGLTASELGARLGQPTFQVREGAGTKLQWADNRCVLDAYLYLPVSGRGVERVAHVDARRPTGDDFDVEACLNLLTR